MENYKIKQFEDKGLAHFSYAVLANERVILVDPARDPQPYYEFAEANRANIIGIIETHPHADFISSHKEIHQTTGATIHISKLVDADYPHLPFDEGDEIDLGEGIKIRSINTPGHSPDSITAVLSAKGKDQMAFTGDTLFIGDVGRPDLRESTGKLTAKRLDLAKSMYHSIREKLMLLNDDVIVYPAHGAGSLCGKSFGDANNSTIGQEKRSNYALQEMTEEEFVTVLLEDQPFVPKYFPYDVDLNKQGAPGYQKSVQKVKRMPHNFKPDADAVIIDGRPSDQYKTSHLPGAINLMDGEKFETWLGSIVSPSENYYILAQDEQSLKVLIDKASKIGYELLLTGAFTYDDKNGETLPAFDKEKFKKDQNHYTIIDVRNKSETKNGLIFDTAINIPLPELRERVNEIPKGKPIVVHCGGGYRSAAGSSIINNHVEGQQILDMSESIKEFESDES